MDIEPILAYSFLGNTVKQYAISAGIFIITYVVLSLFKFGVIKKLKKLALKTKTEIDDLLVQILDNIHWPFYSFMSLFVASQYLQLHPFASRILSYIFIIVSGYYVVKALQDLIKYGTSSIIKKQQETDKNFDSTALELLSKIAKIILWVLAGILILSNLGYNVSTLLAGVGIGGIAIAFALQNILSDIFSSFSIYFDKPFQKGDLIVIGPDKGYVRKIGIKSTRIQTMEGQELVVPNKELTSIRINNFKKMEKRRAIFRFSVVYETSLSKMKKIPEIVNKIIASTENAEFERVHFKEFGDFSLNYEAAYFLNSNKENIYRDAQHKINLALKEAFEKDGISLAYPTQKLYLAKES